MKFRTMREEAELLLLQSEHATADLIRVREIPRLHRPAYVVHVKNHGERRGRAVFCVVPEFHPCAR